ncbi:LOW QUALITY PROTEIN: hypothetical protein HJC23_000890, partial [Cyclotella cryptica]
RSRAGQSTRKSIHSSHPALANRQSPSDEHSRLISYRTLHHSSSGRKRAKNPFAASFSVEATYAIMKHRSAGGSSSSLCSKIHAGCFYTCLAVYTVTILFGRSFLPPQNDWCPYTTDTNVAKYGNPDYNHHPCQTYRTPHLLYLHLQEVEFAQRILCSLLLGGVIGFERRASERPAGIRTMSMVCLGSCFFSMTSQLALKSSTMGWDAARVAAAVPSGVGFLGAGLIWKGSTSSTREVDGKVVTTSSQEVHGLTTAASVWLSAAVGVAVGGGKRLYIVSVYGVALVILILRFGPQMYFAKDSESEVEWDDVDDSELDWDNFTDDSSDILSQYDNGKDDNELEFIERFPESGSYDDCTDAIASQDIETQFGQLGTIADRETEPLLEHHDVHSSPTRRLMRHVSAPDVMALTYETPIIDHSDVKRAGGKTRSGRKKRIPNIMKLSFHG